MTPIRSSLLVLVGLAVVGFAWFAPVLGTDFWSPEDLHELENAARALARGDLHGRPVLAGGYGVNPIFALEFRGFGLDARSYLLVNLLIHILNAFLAYLLVNSLLHDRLGALLSAILFVLTVGSYGKNLMFATGISSLMYASAVLLAMLLYVQNEKRSAGRLASWWSAGFFAIFIASLFMRGGTFSILAAVLFYNLFFRAERQRPILHTISIACVVILVAAVVWRQWIVPAADASAPVSAGAFLRNLPGYLVLMVFPVQQSQTLAEAPGLLQAVYRMAPVLRVLAFIAILSYSFFGFVFGNRTIRFYIAWMYVMIAPFVFFRYPADWLNLRFLYLVSLGFCVLLTTGSLYAYRLLRHRRHRRYLAFSILAVYVLATGFLIAQLNRKNHELASHPSTVARKARIAAILEGPVPDAPISGAPTDSDPAR